jgi:hypothetical protein
MRDVPSRFFFAENLSIVVVVLFLEIFKFTYNSCGPNEYCYGSISCSTFAEFLYYYI